MLWTYAARAKMTRWVPRSQRPYASLVRPNLSGVPKGIGWYSTGSKAVDTDRSRTLPGRAFQNDKERKKLWVKLSLAKNQSKKPMIPIETLRTCQHDCHRNDGIFDRYCDPLATLTGFLDFDNPMRFCKKSRKHNGHANQKEPKKRSN